jgi:uncharacterized protein YjbI with pentapeptide repeats
MATYVLRYADNRKPGSVRSLDGESPKAFIARLRREHIANARELHQMTMAQNTPAFDQSRFLSLRALVKNAPFRSAMIGDLLRQAREQGDAAAVTADGRLDLRGLKLTAQDFTKSDLSGCDFSKCNLINARLTRAKCASANFDGSGLNGVEASGADFTNAGLTRCRIKSSNPGLAARNGVKDIFSGHQKATFVGADFTGADLSEADIADADFTGGTTWNKAKLDRTSLEGCDFTDAELDGVQAREAVFFKNKMHIKFPLYGKFDGARFLLNSYFEMPDIMPLVKSPSTAARRVKELVDNVWHQYQDGQSELRRDMRQNIGALVLSTAMGAGAVTMLAGAATAAAPLIGVAAAHIGATAAVGSVAVWAHSDSVKKLLTKASEFVLTHLGGVCEAIEMESGSLFKKLKAGGAALLAFGHQANLVAEEIRQRPELEPELYLSTRNGVFIMDSEEKIRNLLGHLCRKTADGSFQGYLDHDGKLRDGVTVVREVGGNLPEETAPCQVTVSPNGRCVARWRAADGSPAMSVLYDKFGSPLAFKDGEGRRLTADQVENPVFLQPRAALEDLKSAVIQNLVAHDERTHRAYVGKDGTIVIRDTQTARIDNNGGVAILHPDGTGTKVEQGVRLEQDNDAADLAEERRARRA